MGTNSCFVIQRFDGDTYDRRYRETFAPAIAAGGAQPVRADEVLGTQPVIEKIIDKLNSSNIVFAEISEDNPNVFLELGFALALKIPTVLVCDKGKRSRLPFDVAHRPVLFYKTDSQSDWETIAKQVEENVRAACTEADQNRAIATQSMVAPADSNDLDAIMHICLLECLEADLRSGFGSVIYALQRSIVGPNASERMVSLAIAKLIDVGYLESVEAYDNDSHENYISIKITDVGRKYVLRSYAALQRAEESRLPKAVSKRPKSFDDDLNDDVPF